jgi:hypothetical protein
MQMLFQNARIKKFRGRTETKPPFVLFADMDEGVEYMANVENVKDVTVSRDNVQLALDGVTISGGARGVFISAHSAAVSPRGK